jgi:hypothetical protein
MARLYRNCPAAESMVTRSRPDMLVSVIGKTLDSLI